MSKGTHELQLQVQGRSSSNMNFRLHCPWVPYPGKGNPTPPYVRMLILSCSFMALQHAWSFTQYLSPANQRQGNRYCLNDLQCIGTPHQGQDSRFVGTGSHKLVFLWGEEVANQFLWFKRPTKEIRTTTKKGLPNWTLQTFSLLQWVTIYHINPFQEWQST